MNNQSRDAFLGIGVAWAGLHLVGFGIYVNGGAYKGNPVWDFLSAIFQIELYAFLIAAVAAAIFVAVRVYIFLTTPLNETPPKPELLAGNKNQLKQLEVTSSTPTASTPSPPQQKPTPQPLEPLPPQPPPTAAELKQRALRQITGKEF